MESGKFKPLGDRVLVKPIKVDETKSSGGVFRINDFKQSKS